MPLPPVPVSAALALEAKAEAANEPIKPVPMEMAKSQEDVSGQAEVATKPEEPDASNSNEAAEDAVEAAATADAADGPGGDAEEADAAETAQQEPGKQKRKAGLRARVLAELKSASPLDVKARLEAQLAENEKIVAAAMAVEAAKQQLVDEAMVEVDREAQAVKEVTELEAQALGRIKDLGKRKREAAKVVAERQKEVQHHEDLLVLLGFEVERRRKLKEAEANAESEKDAKRQKIQELLQVAQPSVLSSRSCIVSLHALLLIQLKAEEAKKAQDEMRQREKDGTVYRGSGRMTESSMVRLELRGTQGEIIVGWRLVCLEFCFSLLQSFPFPESTELNKSPLQSIFPMLSPR